MQNLLNRVKKVAKSLCYILWLLKKLPKENIGSMGENSPNLVTLIPGGRCHDHIFLRFATTFGEKNLRFSQKPMLWSNFCII
jgi:hypothetical protein